MFRARDGITLLEILTGLLIFGLALIPMVTVLQQGVSSLEVDTIRFEGEAICHNTIERFGRPQDGLMVYLSPTADPNVFEGSNLWEALPEIYAAMGYNRVAFLVSRYSMSMTVRLRKNIGPGLDALSCELTWTLPKTMGSQPQRVAYVRFLAHDHLH